MRRESYTVEDLPQWMKDMAKETSTQQFPERETLNWITSMISDLTEEVIEGKHIKEDPLVDIPAPYSGLDGLPKKVPLRVVSTLKHESKFSNGNVSPYRVTTNFCAHITKYTSGPLFPFEVILNHPSVTASTLEEKLDDFSDTLKRLGLIEGFQSLLTDSRPRGCSEAEYERRKSAFLERYGWYGSYMSTNHLNGNTHTGAIFILPVFIDMVSRGWSVDALAR